MNAPPFLSAPILNVSDVAHGFFSREGGISKGRYRSLNAAYGSDDAAEAVTENRRRCAASLGVTADHLLTANQVHSPDVAIVNGPWQGAPERCDGLVTKTPGLALGILTADCMPFLFVDPEAKIIGAAHAGWRGALAGILENTVTAMVRLGANPAHIHTALGPCLRQPNFEVGIELLDAFTAKYPEAARYFAPGKSDEKRQLDLAGFGVWRLREAGIAKITDLDICTLASPERYFSYRAITREGGTDYGRNLSAIALK